MSIIIAIMICIIIFSNNSYIAAKDAFMLWVNNVIPSLLPFFICINLLKHTSFTKIIGKLLTPVMRPLFNVPGSGAFAIAMGITSGYPTGAKICAELYADGECSRTEAERLLSFTNTSGPLFIISAVGISMFQSQEVGAILLLIHFLASITVGIIFRNYKSSEDKSPSIIIPHNSNEIKQRPKISTNSKQKFITSSLNLDNLGTYMGESIQNSISTLLLVGGYIVFFAVLGTILSETGIINILSNLLQKAFVFCGLPQSFASPLIQGILEVTNGLKNLSIATFSLDNVSEEFFSSEGYKTAIILASFLLGFGGLSVLMQTASIISTTNLSIKPYIIGKILHGIIASFYTIIFIKYTSFLSLGVIPTFSYTNVSNPVLHETSNLITCICTLILIGVGIKVIKKWCH